MPFGTTAARPPRPRFEPAHGKGAAARAVFYFLLRYPDEISADEVASDRWQLLVDWHHQDPVSLWERHRNAERQGNRNPYIDHAEWLTAVFGSSWRSAVPRYAV